MLPACLRAPHAVLAKRRVSVLLLSNGIEEDQLLPSAHSCLIIERRRFPDGKAMCRTLFDRFPDLRSIAVAGSVCDRFRTTKTHLAYVDYIGSCDDFRDEVRIRTIWARSRYRFARSVECTYGAGRVSTRVMWLTEQFGDQYQPVTNPLARVLMDFYECSSVSDPSIRRLAHLVTNGTTELGFIRPSLERLHVYSKLHEMNAIPSLVNMPCIADFKDIYFNKMKNLEQPYYWVRAHRRNMLKE
jgi:hypothetical protein